MLKIKPRSLCCLKWSSSPTPLPSPFYFCVKIPFPFLSFLLNHLPFPLFLAQAHMPPLCLLRGADSSFPFGCLTMHTLGCKASLSGSKPDEPLHHHSHLPPEVIQFALLSGRMYPSDRSQTEECILRFPVNCRSYENKRIISWKNGESQGVSPQIP